MRRNALRLLRPTLLGHYNGSLGKAEYPNLVLGAWKKWEYEPTGALQISPPTAK